MTGNILNQMLRQEGNFCDPAASAQYRLAKIPTLQISNAKQINVYKYLSNIVVNSTTPNEKPLLSPSAYIATVINDVDGANNFVSSFVFSSSKICIISSSL